MLADKHPEEARRLKELRALDILDTDEEADFDDIVALAAEICQVPIALISFVDQDRQWFKARVGLEARETGLDKSVCSHALLQEGVFEVSDTTQDPRTADNPLVNDPDVNMQFYAGAPLMGENDMPLGTLCVLDNKPRTLSDAQKRSLSILSRRVIKELELRSALKRTVTLSRANAEKAATLERMLELSDTLKLEIDHRVKNSLQQVSSFLSLQASRASDDNVRDALAEARGRVNAIASVHAELGRARATNTVDLAYYVPSLAEELQIGAPTNVTIAANAPSCVVGTNFAAALGIIINEFVANSLKHAFPDDRLGRITIDLDVASEEMLRICLRDNGVGRDVQGNGAAVQDGAGQGGSGLGSRIITAIAQQIGAVARDADTKGPGTALSLEIPRGALREPSVAKAANG